jgi:predicted acylesterase/phospholipase RssA
MYVIADQGGGFNGIKQVPVVEGLYARRVPDYHFGVSTGALIGVLAAAGKLQVFRDTLADVDDPRPLNGVTGIMKPAFDGKGWYELDTLRALLKENVRLKDLQTVFAAGITLKESKRYITLYSNKMKKNRRLYNAVLGSCAVAGVWSPPPRMKHQGRFYTPVDGGHIHSIPFVPPEIQGKRVTELDVILSTPMDPELDEYEEHDGMFESFVWMLETAFAQTLIHGLEHLHMLAVSGVTVRIFAPRTKVGGYAKADADTIAAQYAEGDWMLKNPTTL